MRVLVAEYSDLVDAIDDRRRSLAFSQLELDFRAGIQDGYSAKIICGDRGLGPVSLPCILGALGLQLEIEPAADAPPLTDTYTPAISKAVARCPCCGRRLRDRLPKTITERITP